jgi:hypothetical protein
MPEWLQRLSWLWPTDQFVVRDDPVARKFIHRMKQEAAPVIFRRTVGIYGADASARPYILGTGIPLELAGRRFVVTAAHVMDDIQRMKHGVYVSPGMAGGQLVDLDGCQVNKSHLPKEGREKDPFDICLIGLTDQAAASIGTGVEFVTDEMVDYDEPRQEGAFYFFLGFPRANLKIDTRRNILRCEALNYGTFIYRGERGVWQSPPEGDYVDLDFDPSKTVDDRGRRVRTPRPKGISGCGIWRLCVAGANAANWSVHDIRLVAIEHRWDSHLHVLRGTLYCYINQLVTNNYPEVAKQVYAAWRDRKRLRRQAIREADGTS